MKENCAWNFPCPTRYYLTHPLRWCKHLKTNIRDCYHRIKYGFCPNDVWDWDVWFIYVVPKMFRYLAEHGMAYPGREPFTTPEKWHDWLNETADLIESGDEDWQNKHNEYYEDWVNYLFGDRKKMKVEDLNLTPRERTDLDKNYLARSNELAEQGERNIQIALGRIAEHFFELWD